MVKHANKEIIKDDDLTYALDSSGRMVYIDSIPSEKRGLKCGCICPKCKRPLVAKLGNEDIPHHKRPHFAHQPNTDCRGYYMTALHQLAEQIIQDNKSVMAPAYKSIPADKLSFKRVLRETRVDRPDLQPDVAGYTDDRACWNIEIRNTSEVNEDKKRKIKESGITCLEIDVRGQSLEGLEKFLLESTDNREWINNPIYDRRIREFKYGKTENQYEKYSIYIKDKCLKIKKKTDCQHKCEYLLYRDNCIYKVDELYIDDEEIVVCDIAHIKRDYEEGKKLSQKKVEITPSTSHIATPPPHDYVQDLIDEEKLYLDFDVYDMPIDMIMYTIKEKGKVHLSDNIEGIIEKCQLLKSSEGIVMLCKCNDRIYAYYVLVIWIEGVKLRYDIFNRCREKLKHLAEGKYKKALDEFVTPNKINYKYQEDLFKENNDPCPF